jgi:hypothetical protein
MKKEMKFLQDEAYVSPAIAVVEISTEGVLCASGVIENWEEETLPW